MKALVRLATIIALCPWAALSAPRPKLTPAAILHEVQEKGSKATVQDLIKNEKTWERVLIHIHSGADAWLDVAASLRKGSDAGPSEALDSAMAKALSRNPVGVLSRLQGDFKPEDVCTCPLIEATDAEVNAFMARTRAALENVTGPMAPKAKDCLARLNAQ